MVVKKRSLLTGNLNEMELPIDPQKYAAWLHGSDLPASDFFNELSSEEIEFVLTGVTPDEEDSAWVECSAPMSKRQHFDDERKYCY